jgi:hypothetical protein
MGVLAERYRSLGDSLSTRAYRAGTVAMPWLARQTLAELSARYRARAGAGGRPDTRVKVSLTSYPARLSRARLPVYSLLCQSVRPAEVVLVLSEHEFAGRGLPDWVHGTPGLRVLWTTGKSARSYQKLVPPLREDPAATIVTADDDMLYPRDWLAGLLRAAAADPRRVVGYRGLEVAFGDGRPLPFLQWPRARDTTASPRLHLTGVGGILYPPGALAPEVVDLGLALELCPTNDDVWFHAMTLLGGTQTRMVYRRFIEFPQYRGSQREGNLMTDNLGAGQTDVQIANVFNHFDLWPALKGRRAAR